MATSILPKDREYNIVNEYNTDLNIILVVAGLLASAASAFVVYVHPNLEPDFGEQAVNLSRVALYNTNPTLFGNEIPEIPEWTGPEPTIVVSLVLLYLSLGFMTATVLFSILAKQMLYLFAFIVSESVPPRRDVLDKRLKRLGVGIVFLLSSMLQISLLLLDFGLIVYTWKVNLKIAIQLISLTALVIPFYFFFALIGLENIGFFKLPWWKMIWS